MPKAAKININLYVGQRLRARRVSLGLSQEAVGTAVGMASQQVQKYEKGVNAMNAKRLCDFAVFLKVPVAYFFEGLPLGIGGSSGASGSAAASPAIGRRSPAASPKMASDRESLEVLKSFKSIKDYAVRKRLADLLRSLSLKDI